MEKRAASRAKFNQPEHFVSLYNQVQDGEVLLNLTGDPGYQLKVVMKSYGELVRLATRAFTYRGRAGEVEEWQSSIVTQ